MLTLLIFAATLFAAVLLSDLAQRSPLSTAALFLGAGLVAGPAVLGAVRLDAAAPPMRVVAVAALVAVLFGDGMRLRLRDLRGSWTLPARALLVGLPLTVGIVAVLTRYVTGLSWPLALLVGAVLAPTDPVFASGIANRPEVPARLRRLLNVESGLNDGLAFPLVVVLLAVAGGAGHSGVHLVLDLVAGVALGVVIPLAAARLERLRVFAISADHEPLAAVAVLLAVVGAAEVAGANVFLGAFVAGVTMGSVRPGWQAAYHRVGEPVTEVVKLAAVFAFGVVLSSATVLGAVGWRGWLLAVAILAVARPVAMHLAMLGARLSRAEVAVAGWFGPKGFASVVFGLYVLGHGSPATARVFPLVAAAVAVSIVGHGSTDVPVARWYGRRTAGVSR